MVRGMRPFSQKQPFAQRDALIQGDSVRQIWGFEEPNAAEVRKPLRRDGHFHEPVEPAPMTDDVLRIRLGEELEYARRLLDLTGDSMAADPIAVGRHGVALQSLDIVGQMLGHIANVIRSSLPAEAVESIGMCDLKARLQRSEAL